MVVQSEIGRQVHSTFSDFVCICGCEASVDDNFFFTLVIHHRLLLLSFAHVYKFVIAVDVLLLRCPSPMTTCQCQCTSISAFFLSFKSIFSSVVRVLLTVALLLWPSAFSTAFSVVYQHLRSLPPSLLHSLNCSYFITFLPLFVLSIIYHQQQFPSKHTD